MFLLATRIGDLAMRSASIASLGQAIHETLRAVMPVENLYIAVYDPNESLIRFPYWRDRHDPCPKIKSPGVGLTEYVLRKGISLVADAARLEELERQGECLVLGTRPRFWIGIPLVRRGETFGVVAIQSYEEDPPLDARHAELLSKLAPTLSVAVFAQQIGYRRDRRDALLQSAADCAMLFLQDVRWSRYANEALACVGRAADVSRAYVFQVEQMPDGRFLADQRFEWVAEGIEPQIDNPMLQRIDLAKIGFQRWVDFLRRGEPISGPVAQMPVSEQPLLKAQDIQSLHIVPIHVGDKWWGFLGFDDCLMPRAWSAAERESLRLVAMVFSQAIHRENVHHQFQIQQTALSAVANGVLITDADGTILWVNDALCRSSGYSAQELIGQKPSIFNAHVHPPAFFRDLWDTIQHGLVWTGEITNRRKDGSIYTEETTITPIRDASGKLTHFIAIKQDITERKHLQHQLAQIQRLESIGRLAGGIAHDFNNLLQAITGFGSMLLMNMGESDPRRQDALEILRAADVATNLTRQLLTFSRRQRVEVTTLQVNDVVRTSEKLLKRLLPENIAIEMDLDPALPLVQGDAAQLEQVLVNLAINARDAMPDGGTLKIATRAAVFPSKSAAESKAMPGKPCALLEVTDTGVGMAPEILEKIFEPFFTTKDPGRGTGLGLPVVYGIIRQHDGFIDVESRPNGGSAFRIFLPFASPDAATSASRSEKASDEKSDGAVGRGEHILVVEDEESVRELTKRVLSLNKYRVSTARTAAEARALFSTTGSAFDLLFSDVVLPDGSGLDLGEEFRRLRPELKVVLTSGYTQQRDRWRERISRLDGFLPKPYPPPALLRAIRSALDARP